MANWTAASSYDEAIATDTIPMPVEGSRNTLRSWEVIYRYLTIPYAYTIRHLNDGSSSLSCWATPEAAAKQAETYTEVYRILTELNITAATPQEEAILRINQWICNHKSYAYTKGEFCSTPYFSLTSSSGKCHNYALAFQLLCLGAGI